MFNNPFYWFYGFSVGYALTAIILALVTALFPNHTTRNIREGIYWTLGGGSGSKVLLLKQTAVLGIGIFGLYVGGLADKTPMTSMHVHAAGLITAYVVSTTLLWTLVIERQRRLLEYYANGYFTAKELYECLTDHFENEKIPLTRRTYSDGQIAFIMEGSIDACQGFIFDFFDGLPVRAYRKQLPGPVAVDNEDLDKCLAIISAYREVYYEHCGCLK